MLNKHSIKSNQSSQALFLNNLNKNRFESIKTLKNVLEGITEKISPQQVTEKYVKTLINKETKQFKSKRHLWKKLDMKHLPQRLMNRLAGNQINLLRYFINCWNKEWNIVHPKQETIGKKLEIHRVTVSKNLAKLKIMELVDCRQSYNPSNGEYTVNSYYPGKKLLGFCECILDWWKGSEKGYPSHKKYDNLLNEIRRVAFELKIGTINKRLCTIRRKIAKEGLKMCINEVLKKGKNKDEKT